MIQIGDSSIQQDVNGGKGVALKESAEGKIYLLDKRVLRILRTLRTLRILKNSILETHKQNGYDSKSNKRRPEERVTEPSGSGHSFSGCDTFVNSSIIDG